MQPYSESQIHSLLASGKIAFTGNFCSYFEQISGSQQNWNRDYDPAIGRYLQSDPIGITKDFDHNPEFEVMEMLGLGMRPNAYGSGLNHMYGYVEQNPVMRLDALGLTSNVDEARKMWCLEHEDAPQCRPPSDDGPSDTSPKPKGPGDGICEIENPFTSKQCIPPGEWGDCLGYQKSVPRCGPEPKNCKIE